MNYLNKQKTFALHFLEFLLNKSVKMQSKKKLGQNTVCLEQKKSASQENFTQPPAVMVDPFRRSGLPMISSTSLHFIKLGPLGRVGLVVAMSVFVFVPSQRIFFQGLSLALR